MRRRRHNAAALSRRNVAPAARPPRAARPARAGRRTCARWINGKTFSAYIMGERTIGHLLRANAQMRVNDYRLSSSA